ncbi:MAG: hypothetical protein PHS71_09740 [Proteiniphilum sp.]|nr:hypothetical protein [Proteiniphilum sp.]
MARLVESYVQTKVNVILQNGTEIPCDLAVLAIDHSIATAHIMQNKLDGGLLPGRMPAKDSCHPAGGGGL